MRAAHPKALSIPRIPHQGWRLPWLQMEEGKRQAERQLELQSQRHEERMAAINAQNQMIMDNYRNQQINNYSQLNAHQLTGSNL